MAEKEKVHWTYWLHLAIGAFFMFGFPMFEPIEPLTEIGMTIVGVFVGMVYLWSALDSIWPSLLGLLLVAIAGYIPDMTGYVAVKQLFLEAFGSETVVVCILGMVLFAGVEFVGCTKYMARFFMSIKALEGKPYVFLYIFFVGAYFISGLTSPLASMLIMWPIAQEVCATYGYKKGDKVFALMICGVYLASTLGQPMLPFKGASYIVISAYMNMSGAVINFGSYILYTIVMSLMLLAFFLVFVRFVYRPDVEAIKRVTVAELTKEKLPPMNIQQIAFLLMLVAYVVLLLMPNFLPKTIPFVKFINDIGILGLTIIFIVILMVIPYKGKPMLDFKAVAKKSFSWDIMFLVAAAMYVCTAMSSNVTGVKPFLVQILSPLLGDKPVIIFVLLILAFAVTTTNFANNAGMAVVLLPVILSFAEFYPTANMNALAITVVLAVFVALLTPAASPYCGMLHARRDLVSYGEILQLFVPMFFIALISYTFIGYNIASMLF
ncbi:MAG: SLC13 family permease [Peptococcaceae bacterium]|nr:SLC13 family permease [Peptococcaceae bacterium]MBO5429643.1 SLC13 family permease [Peptococcaceae bacterium]